jgi:hypothetical protein
VGTARSGLFTTISALLCGLAVSATLGIRRRRSFPAVEREPFAGQFESRGGEARRTKTPAV